jgi:hypothetical protein
MGNVIGRGVHTLFSQVQSKSKGHLIDEDTPSKIALRAERTVRQTMKLNLIKRVVAEREGFGRVATKPTVSISDNGQVRLNSLAIAALGEYKYLMFSMEGREGAFVALPSLPKGFEEADTIQLPSPTGKDGKPRDFSKQLYFSFGGNLKDAGYDYKNSGNQTFDATATTITAGKNVLKAVGFTLPEGKLEKKESTRKPRISKIAPAPGTPATTAKAVAEDQTAMEDLEL